MKVVVTDYERDQLWEFASRDAAEAWLRANREVTVFSLRSDGMIDCLAPDRSRPVAGITLVE
jgi:hypothetical protein